MLQKKKSKISLILILILIYHCKNSIGNVIRENIQNFNDNIEQIYSNCTVDDLDKVELQNLLENAAENPLDLNSVSFEELEELCILSEEQILALQNHISKYGPLLSIYELQAISEFDLETIQKILAFVYVEESASDFRNNSFYIEGINKKNSNATLQYQRKFITEKENLELSKISSKTGKPKNLGSQDEFLTKIRIRHPNGYDIGIAAKKSPGENFIWDDKNKIYGFNVYRAHLMFQNKGIIKKIILGNYEVGYAQGLINSCGFDMGKSSETIKIIKTGNLGIKPHISPKSMKFCGIATTLQLCPCELTAYYSFAKLDQAIKYSPKIGAYIDAQLSRACSYETFSKLEKRNNLTEQVFGIVLLYKSKKNDFEIGSNTLFNTFDILFWKKNKKDKTNIYRENDLNIDEEEINEEDRNRFSGTKNFATSLFYRYIWRNIHFFGEESISKNISEKTLQTKNISPAFINGAVISLHKTLDTTFLHRYYSPAYNCFYGNPLKESTHAKNEHGIYTGLRYRPFFSWYFDAYFDYVHIPEPYRGQDPNIYNWLIKATYELYKTWIVSLQYTEKIKDAKTTKKERDFFHNSFARAIIKKVKFQSTYSLNPKIRLKNEVHINRYSKVKSSTWGFGIIQDISYKIVDSLKVTTRVGWLAPETQKNSIYSYESKLLNVGRGIHQYTKRGFYFCILMAYRPTNAWRIELKYSHMQKFEQGKPQANTNKYSGNIDNNIGAQVSYAF